MVEVCTLFFVCIVRRGAAGVRASEVFRHPGVVCVCLVCIMWQFRCCVLHDLQFVNACRGCRRQPH